MVHALYLYNTEGEKKSWKGNERRKRNEPKRKSSAKIDS